MEGEKKMEPPKTAGAPRLNAWGQPVGPNGGRSRRANNYPATCYHCGARLPVGYGTVVPWHSKKMEGRPMRVRCNPKYRNCLAQAHPALG